LRDGEDAFAAEFLALLRTHAGHKLRSSFSTRSCDSGLGFAFGAVPVFRMRSGGTGLEEQHGELFSRCFSALRTAIGHEVFTLECGDGRLRDDFAEADIASEHLREGQRVERQQQPPVVLVSLLRKTKRMGNKLGRLASAFPVKRAQWREDRTPRVARSKGSEPRVSSLGRDSRTGLSALCLGVWATRFQGHTANFGGLEAFGGWRRNDALCFRHCFLQSPGSLRAR